MAVEQKALDPISCGQNSKAGEEGGAIMSNGAMEADPNWWRATIAPVGVTSALIVAACLSGLPAINCAELALTYSKAIINFGLAGLVAAAIYVLGIVISAVAKGKTIGQKNTTTNVIGVIATTVTVVIFGCAIYVGISSLNKSTTDCYSKSSGELKRT